jgi:hypothetical protein
MKDILDLLAKYSPPVVLLLAIGAAFIFVLKLIVEKTIDAKFAAQTKVLELQLARRSAFEEKILLDRYMLVAEFSRRFERVFHEVARIRAGQPPPDGFYRGQDVPELTDIHGELNVNRIVLSEEFYQLFSEKEKIAWDAVNKADGIYERRQEIDRKIRNAVERVFRLSEITAQPLGR